MSVRLVALTSGLVAGFAVSACAQNGQGAIAGSVADSTDAVIAGAFAPPKSGVIGNPAEGTGGPDCGTFTGCNGGNKIQWVTGSLRGVTSDRIVSRASRSTRIAAACSKTTAIATVTLRTHVSRWRTNHGPAILIAQPD